MHGLTLTLEVQLSISMPLNDESAREGATLWSERPDVSAVSASGNCDYAR